MAMSHDRPKPEPTARISPLAMLIVCGLAACHNPPTVHAQGYPPDEAPARMTLPQDFTVELVAAEPLVRQPVAMEFDDAGRLWVIQYLQYPNPAGLKREKVDRYSRTKYDRVPDPPPHGPRGADRITILEDTDGDGRADRTKDFVKGLNLATGLAFGYGGVFVLQVPYLLFYPDRDRDDVPDGEPEVLLTGFGMEDAHSVANSLTWGPDGWLYGCQGSTVTADIRGIEFQQGVWRYHPRTRRFELFCEGGGNSWGLDFDAHGNLFYSTNHGGYAMLHGVQGGYYWKQFGKHGALHNPYAYGYFDHVPHQNLRGGHVTVGGLIYQGQLFPEAFRGKYIGADLLGHAVYWHKLQPRGSTFAAAHQGDLLVANDTWFAPSDMTVGPDGAIYVCDWHDQRMAHPDPDAEWDRTNGRIYRIRPSMKSLPAPTPLAGLSSDELVERLSDRNAWYARLAQRILAERRDGSVIPGLEQIVKQAGPGSLRALWALHVSGGIDERFAPSCLSHPQADVRAWTVRLLGDDGRVAPRMAEQLAELAAGEAHVTVRSQLACTAKRLPAEQALPVIQALVQRSEDADDPLIPLLLWWAVEQHAVEARDAIVAALTDAQTRKLPLVHDTILPRLMRRYAAEATEPGYLACAKLLDAVPATDRTAMLTALDQGLRDQRAARGDGSGSLFAELAVVTSSRDRTPAATWRRIPPRLADQLDRVWRDDTTDMVVIRLAARLGRKAAHERVIALAGDESVATETRTEAIKLSGELGQPAFVKPLVRLFDIDKPPAIQRAALDALAAFDEKRIAAVLLDRYRSVDDALRSRIVDVLLGNRNWVGRFLAEVDAGRIAAEDVSVDQLRVVAAHQDPVLDAVVKEHWGRITGGTPEERLAEMRRLNNDLRAAAGDTSTGKALFTKHCGTCHRLHGEGNRVGPELTHANRKNTAELLATIVSPSAIVRREYMSFVVQTVEGRVLTGLLVDQTPGSVTLLDAKNQRTTIPRDRVESIDESPTSLMPDNLLTPLAPQELRDLFAYLQSDSDQSAAK